MRSFTLIHGTSYIVLFLSLLVTDIRSENPFGDSYAWYNNLNDALGAAKSSNKPCMLLIHKSWCGACKSLAPKFASSTEILDLSKNFVMCHLVDDNEPSDEKYKPDGGYIPRIFFISPDGVVQHNFYNKLGSDKYKYFYSRPEDIVETMKVVKAKYPKSSDNQIEL